MSEKGIKKRKLSVQLLVLEFQKFCGVCNERPKSLLSVYILNFDLIKHVWRFHVAFLFV